MTGGVFLSRVLALLFDACACWQRNEAKDVVVETPEKKIGCGLFGLAQAYRMFWKMDSIAWLTLLLMLYARWYKRNGEGEDNNMHSPVPCFFS